MSVDIQVMAMAELERRRRGRSGAQLRPDLSRLESFMVAGWAVLEPTTPLSRGWYLGAIAEHLEAVSHGQIRRLVINIPPRFTKSLTVSVFWQAWDWAEVDPSRRWLFGSYDKALSTRDTVKARDLILSPWYQSLYGDQYQLKRDVNMKTRFENDKTGTRIATSLEAGITGEGAHIRVADDPHSFKQALSDGVRERQVEVYLKAFTNRQINPATDADVVVMQRLHERDLTGQILEQELGYEHLCLPMEFEPSRAAITSLGLVDQRSEEGELLDPGRFPDSEVQRTRAKLGSSQYAGQYQQRPGAAGGTMLMSHWWRYYKPAGTDVAPVAVKTPTGLERIEAQPLPGMDRVVISVDCNFKKAEGLDFVALHVWGAWQANRYLLHRDVQQTGILGTMEMIRQAVEDWPLAKVIYVEAAANGPAVVEILGDEVSGLKLVTPQEVGGSKIARVNAVIAAIESGNIYLSATDREVQDFVDQCSVFPHGAHDDEVDAMTMALIKLGSYRPIKARRPRPKIERRI